MKNLWWNQRYLILLQCWVKWICLIVCRSELCEIWMDIKCCAAVNLRTGFIILKSNGLELKKAWFFRVELSCIHYRSSYWAIDFFNFPFLPQHKGHCHGSCCLHINWVFLFHNFLYFSLAICDLSNHLVDYV